MRCDQEQIQGLINTSREARVNADGIAVTAERVLNALNNSVKSIPTDYESYAKELISACEKVEKSLEEHSKDLIEYAMRVEEMDTSLQTSFAECIIDGYKQTADGVDNRFAYMDIEYSLEELNRLEAKSESERTPEEQAKLEVLRLKAMTEGKTKVMLAIAELERGTKEEGINYVKYNEWFWEKDLSAPWCAAFVLWCGDQAGLMDGNTMPKFEDREGMALVTNLRDWYSDRGRYHSINCGDDYIPCQGDFFVSRSWDSKINKWQYHTGIVAGYDKETKNVYTIEGNIGDAVQHGIRKINVDSDSGIQGFCSNGGMEAELPSGWETWKDVDNIENAGTR